MTISFTIKRYMTQDFNLKSGHNIGVCFTPVFNGCIYNTHKSKASFIDDFGILKGLV